MVPSHHIFQHEEIISKCEGCKKIYKTIHGKRICSCYCFPHTKWWFGEKCSQATNIKHELEEDPIKEP